MTHSKTTSGTALQLLVRANFKELVRDSRSLISMSVFFVVTILVLIALQAMINGGGSTPRLLLTDSVESKVTDQLDAVNGIETRNAADADTDAVNAELTREGPGAGYTVVISSEDRPDWLRIVEALESAGVPHFEITVVDDEGSSQIDFLRQNLSLALLTGYAAIAFVGTAAPFARMRNEGVMTMLGTTPVRARDILIAHAPPRILMCLVETMIVLAIAFFSGYMHGGSWLRLIVSLLLAFGFIFSIGFLLAARAKNPDLVTQLAGLVPIIVLFGSGTVIPIPYLSDVPWVRYLIPTNWMADAINLDLSGIAPTLPWGLLWALMILGTVVLLGLSIRLFNWNESDT
ncbi:MAG: ABC transporter permease [Brevibacterium sp.]|nr:ABC transporter permease [Brevibacterium sp.]MDN5832446.1 ABC transporter permease [Brevibacterium sp.]MDN5875069.1 ABC transporter permease [Brevibacterium sp.]MDN5908822.1 ABC transporter permease [Brevibacterium sp.]MDN6122760.1 ABC transporter permease [Brevibacterium sp.]